MATRRLQVISDTLKRVDMKIYLTKRQIWFIRCAIEAKDVILPLHPENIEDFSFKSDYGISKAEVEKELSDLLNKLPNQNKN